MPTKDSTETPLYLEPRSTEAFNTVPVEKKRSPLDVPGVDADITMEEIIDIIREMRSAGYEDAPAKAAQHTPAN